MYNEGMGKMQDPDDIEGFKKLVGGEDESKLDSGNIEKRDEQVLPTEMQNRLKQEFPQFEDLDMHYLASLSTQQERSQYLTENIKPKGERATAWPEVKAFLRRNSGMLQAYMLAFGALAATAYAMERTNPGYIEASANSMNTLVNPLVPHPDRQDSVEYSRSNRVVLTPEEQKMIDDFITESYPDIVVDVKSLEYTDSTGDFGAKARIQITEPSGAVRIVEGEYKSPFTAADIAPEKVSEAMAQSRQNAIRFGLSEYTSKRIEAESLGRLSNR